MCVQVCPISRQSGVRQVQEISVLSFAAEIWTSAICENHASVINVAFIGWTPTFPSPVITYSVQVSVIIPVYLSTYCMTVRQGAAQNMPFAVLSVF